MENHPLYRPLPKPPAPPPLSAAEQAAFDRDVVRLADFHVESTREKLLNLPKDGQAARDREAAAMFAKWRNKSPLWENRLREAAGNLALPRIRELQTKRGPRTEQTWWEDAIVGMEWTIRSALASLNTPRVYLTVLGSLLAFWIFKALRRKEEQAAPALPELSDNFGSARYAELRTDMPDPYHISGGVFFGKSSAPEHDKKPPSAWQGAPVCSVPEAHTLIVARTRTGKGTRVIVPTLLRYAGSCLVIDPKGENAAITARIRYGLAGRDVHILKPVGRAGQDVRGHGLHPGDLQSARCPRPERPQCRRRRAGPRCRRVPHGARRQGQILARQRCERPDGRSPLDYRPTGGNQDPCTGAGNRQPQPQGLHRRIPRQNGGQRRL
jgi:hypothetical protein